VVGGACHATPQIKKKKKKHDSIESFYFLPICFSKKFITAEG
jgi:hypothetical protein